MVSCEVVDYIDSDVLSSGDGGGGDGNQGSPCLQHKYSHFIYYLKPTVNLHVSLYVQADDVFLGTILVIPHALYVSLHHE